MLELTSLVFENINLIEWTGFVFETIYNYKDGPLEHFNYFIIRFMDGIETFFICHVFLLRLDFFMYQTLGAGIIFYLLIRTWLLCL